eukprot:576118-Amphidinium_carterae.1
MDDDVGSEYDSTEKRSESSWDDVKLSQRIHVSDKEGLLPSCHPSWDDVKLSQVPQLGDESSFGC